MTAVRPPVIVGLAEGSGTSTLAAALHARDAGRFEEWAACAADIVVCRAEQPSLRRAATLACARPGVRPLLAVTLGPGDQEQHAAETALPALQQRFSAVVVLPHVPRWHDRAPQHDDAAAVLAQASEQLTRPLRAYAAALRTLAAGVVGSGLLGRAVPPLLALPVAAPRRSRPEPLRRPEPPRPVLLTPPRSVAPVPLSRVAPGPEPDDEEIEAEPVRAGVAAGRAE
ncbi:hypothetical protein [Pseudonocardia xinjiangensis]|uniref:hypothetical protein n=1 Tax=Pseudonocardia xinjiangensis TaxID=75289 RepID=UPI001B7CEF5F|nr:hypothetical protein [Pseudonocardia xinjiangensis]